MSSEPTGNDILDQYRGISSKLKRRFLRKPNVSEACESFAALSIQCESSELPAYAGMCWISAARCEGSLGNIPGEASCLVRAGRQFLSAETKDHSLGCPSPSHENLEAALGCFAYASSRYPEDCILPIGLTLEMAEAQEEVNKLENMEQHLQFALKLTGDSPEARLLCLDRLARLYIESSDYHKALQAYSTIKIILDELGVNGSRADTLLKCEVARVLLLLIIMPEPHHMTAASSEFLGKYIWSSINHPSLRACRMTQEMFTLLHSLISSCQPRRLVNLDHIVSALCPMIGNEEKFLLQTLCHMFSIT